MASIKNAVVRFAAVERADGALTTVGLTGTKFVVEKWLAGVGAVDFDAPAKFPVAPEDGDMVALIYTDAEGNAVPLMHPARCTIKSNLVVQNERVKLVAYTNRYPAEKCAKLVEAWAAAWHDPRDLTGAELVKVTA